MNGGRAAAALVLLLFGGSVAAQAGFGTYGYDKSGNITSVGSDTFRYDAFGRLYTSVLAGFGSQTYTYDRYGNIVRIDRSTDSQAANPSVDALTNRMNAPFSATGGNLIAQYDAAGNVIEYNQDVFVYDALNMMKETTDPERRLHIYTASDERVVIVTAVNNVETKSEWTLRDAGNRVLRRFEKDTSGWHWKEDYVYGGGRLIAADVPGSERVRHFHLDHLGTPRLVTGNGGVQLASKTYEPFGPKVNDTTATPAAEPEQLEFTGHERDVPTLDYMHARYYQPYLGRFLSVDPTWASADLNKPQSWNRYSYVLNNPVNKIDPDGRNALAAVRGAAVLCASSAVCADRAVKMGVNVGLLATSFSDRMDEAADRLEEDRKYDVPADPDELLDAGYEETSHPEAAAAGHRSFENPTTGDKLRFDKGKSGKPGHEGRDHYHRENPNATGKTNQYLDGNGNPVPRGSDASHLYPKGFWERVRELLSM